MLAWALGHIDASRRQPRPLPLKKQGRQALLGQADISRDAKNDSLGPRPSLGSLPNE